MTRTRVIVAVYIVLGLPGLAISSEPPAELWKLLRRLDEQEDRIRTLTQHVLLLRHSAGDASPSPGGRPAASASARDKLKFVVSKFEVDDATFAVALDALKDMSRLDIVVDWRALQAAGVEKGVRVSLHLADVSVEKLLRVLLLECAAGGAPLAFVLEGQTIRVTTQEEIEKRTVTKVYDVSRLIPPGRGPAAAQARHELEEQIRRIDGVSWEQPGRSVAFDGGRMTVSQHPSAIQAVDDFLPWLEERTTLAGARAGVLRRSQQIARLQADVAALTAKCKAAGKAAPPEPVPAEAAMRKAVSFGADATAMSDCLDALRQAGGMSIHVKWSALTLAGIDKSRRITLPRASRSLEQTLTLLLRQAGGDPTPLDFCIEEDVITVSTRQDLDMRAATRVYVVGDLLPARTNRQEALHKLTMTLQQQCAPETWRMAGGTPGSVRPVGGNLLITQSLRVHRLIRAHLETMRR